MHICAFFMENNSPIGISLWIFASLLHSGCFPFKTWSYGYGYFLCSQFPNSIFCKGCPYQVPKRILFFTHTPIHVQGLHGFLQAGVFLNLSLCRQQQLESINNKFQLHNGSSAPWIRVPQSESRVRGELLYCTEGCWMSVTGQVLPMMDSKKSAILMGPH